MKTISNSLTLFFVIIATISGYAQSTVMTTDTRNDFKLGIKAGVNISNVYDEHNNDFVADSKVGFVGGGFFALPFGTYLGFQPEVLYSQKGFKATSSSILGDFDYTHTSSYLDIPLQLQIKPIPMLTILVGPQFSYLLKTKNNFNGNVTTTQEEDINSRNYRKNIYGFVVGADVHLNSFIITGRAGWDINQSDIDGDTTKPRYKNQVLQFMLGYAF